MNPTQQTYSDHERKEADVVSLFAIVMILAVACAVIFIGVAGLMHYFTLHEPAKTAGEANIPVTHSAEFPQPRIEVSSGGDLKTLRAAEDVDLDSHGWIDRNKGT